jgi:hydrogenase expression/formation protein HypE
MTDVVKMVHGAGGQAMQSFIKEYILRHLGWGTGEIPLSSLDDSGAIDGVVLKSDSYTVKPLFFPGGDIGSLAVAGTINDILMIGGRPIALALGLIIEEGFPFSDLDRILKSISNTAMKVGVPVITGDTKVVEKGALENLVLNMSGLGVRHPYLDHNLEVVKKYRDGFDEKWLLDSNIKPGDKIIITGYIGDHAIALLSVREGVNFEADIKSDAAPLNGLVEAALKMGGVVAMKDPTRGGLANLLNEWSEKSGVGIKIYEERIPIRDSVRNVCEYLGLDPLELGNEGKAAIAVIPELADTVLEAIRRNPLGKDAEIIGEATDEYDFVIMETVIGGLRAVPPPIGDPIPRIC